MRVIAGSAKHIPLKTVAGNDTRPTTDKVKETLFNILNFKLDSCIFLDLFSGSGAIGIEALSRGAKKAYFVEKSRKAADCIKENLQKTKLEERAEVLIGDVLKYLSSLEAKKRFFDMIFMDPPYDKNLEVSVMDFLKNSKMIDIRKKPLLMEKMIMEILILKSI